MTKWQNDNVIVQSKVTKYIKIKSQTQKCMFSSWGPAGVTSLKWKLYHKSIIQQDDWQIRGCLFRFYREQNIAAVTIMDGVHFLWKQKKRNFDLTWFNWEINNSFVRSARKTNHEEEGQLVIQLIRREKLSETE